MSEPEYHATQNLYEAAYCLCQGFKLAGKHQQGRKMVVCFEGHGVREAALQFYNGATVEAKALTDAYRTLKDYVFER